MYINKRRTIYLTMVSILLFISGANYEKLANYFLNLQAAIGFLFVVILIMTLYIVYLKESNLEYKLRNERDLAEDRNHRYELENKIRYLQRLLNNKRKTKTKK